MKDSFNFIILAVTKTYDKFCIAGMNENGKWIRPLPVGKEKFWRSERYTNGEFIKVGDVWEIAEYEDEYDIHSPGHTEDLRLLQSPKFKEHYTNNKLLNFVEAFKEDKTALSNTLNGVSRSLCLVKAENFKKFLFDNPFNGRKQARFTFLFEGNHYNNTTSTPGFPITDLKWRAYTFQQIKTTNDWNNIFICIGLARTEPKKRVDREYPMIISVITDPEVPLLPTYPL